MLSIEQKQAEKAMRESQARLSGIVESAMDAIITVDNNQHILLFNHAAEKMFLCTAEEAVGQSLERFIPERFRSTHLSHQIQYFGETDSSTSAMAGTRTVYGLRADGQEFPAEASISQVEAEGQKFYTVIMRDITERVRAEETQNILASIVDSSDDAIISKKFDGTILSWNRAAEKIFGYPSEEIIGQNISILFPPELLSEEAEIIKKIKRGERIDHYETTRIKKDGSLVTISLSVSPIKNKAGEVIGVSKIARDISEQKLAEEIIRNSEKRLRRVLDNLFIFVGLALPDGTLVEVNRAPLEAAEVKLEDVVGQKVWETVWVNYNPDIQRQMREEYKKAAQGEIIRYDLEIQVAGGNLITVDYMLAPVRDDNGNITHLLSSGVDITDRKHAEEVLKEAEQRFRAIFEEAAVGIVQVAPDGRFLRVNKRCCEILGYTEEEMICHTFNEFTHPDDVSSDLEVKDKMLAGEIDIISFEKRYLHKNQSVVWANLTVSLVRDTLGKPKYFITSVQDISQRKKAEEELREKENLLYESDRRLAEIVHSMSEACFALDADWRFTFINDKTETLLQHSREELLGKSIWDVFDKLVGTPMEKQYRRAMKDRVPISFEAFSPIAERWLDIRLFPSGDGLAAFLLDIQERKTLEAERQKFVSLAQNSVEFIGMCDLQGKPFFVNEAGWQLVGLDSLDEALKQNLTDYFFPEDREFVLNEFLPKVLSEGNAEVEMRFRHFKSGGEIWMLSNVFATMDEHHQPIGFATVSRNISEYKNAEDQLRQSEKRYRLLFESNPQPLWVYDYETLAFLEVNDAAIYHYGYSREEFLSMTIKDIRPMEDIARLLDDIPENANSYHDAMIWRHRKKDGSIIDVEISAHSFTFNDRPARLILAHDITERRTLEAQLRQSQKMEAIGQLAGGIAHDFNNLLTVINGYTELMMRRLNVKDPFQQNLEEVLKAGKRAASLTRQLLAFSRKQVLQPKILDLNTVVSEIEKMLQRLIGENIELRTLLEPKLGSIQADPGQIEQIILNLAVNARDAMPGGGKLTVETMNIYLDEDYAKHHMTTKPGHYIVLAISDNGVGMDEKTQAHIFEPFFTTKEIGQGTGLGLSTVYGIVKQSNGFIWVYSEIGQGTSFKVYLPRVDETASEYRQNIETNHVLPGTETILLVEDEEIVRRLVQEILESSGYQVLDAANGNLGISICEQYPQPIDLLITDVIMPEMSGPELAERLSQLRPEMKVLYMSGYTDNAIVHQGLLNSSTNFLQKPFTPDSLSHKVRRILDNTKT